MVEEKVGTGARPPSALLRAGWRQGMMYSPLTVPPDQVPRTGLVARVEDEVLHVTWCAPGGEIGQASMPRYVEGAYSTLSVPVSLTFRFEEGL